MAKNGVVKDGDGDGDPAVANVVELKRELRRIVKAIAVVVEDDCSSDDVNLEALDRAHRLLCALKELKIKKRSSLSVKIHDSSTLTVPQEFCCPLSKQLMRDPVIVATGQVCHLCTAAYPFLFPFWSSSWNFFIFYFLLVEIPCGIWRIFAMELVWGSKD